jgi:glycosyltransferase involved in cell wall biosynthesis
MADAQHSARALYEAEALVAFVTTFAYRPHGRLASLLTRLPGPQAKGLSGQLARRTIDEVPPDLVHAYPAWEVLRSAVAKAGGGPVAVDRVWDRMSHSFDELVARRYVPRAAAVQAFEYTALAAFERAEQEGVARVLHLPSLDSLEFEDIQRREKCLWPELIKQHDCYFDRKFGRRYERRQKEIALSDIIIANSSLTAASHIKAGADPSRVFVVPLAAPPPIAEVEIDAERRRRPLDVVWAGSFSLGKGAHYLLKAWQLLNARAAARLHVYGQVLLPDQLRASQADGVIFHGSVPRHVLFNAYESSDVLVFPTLSDGFGMVVTEAMSRGVPVITTDRAGAADLVTADNGMIVPAADPQALANALQWCLDNRNRLLEMRNHALETARRRQWPDFRKDLINALDKGLSQAGYHSAYKCRR